MVVYADIIDEGDKMEIVRKEYGKPYAQQITKDGFETKIARMNLYRQPKVVSEADAAPDAGHIEYLVRFQFRDVVQRKVRTLVFMLRSHPPKSSQFFSGIPEV